MVVLKYFVLQIPALLICALAYFQVVTQLKKGAENAQKRIISVCFFLVWLVWLVLSMPFGVYELYQQLHGGGLIGTFNAYVLQGMMRNCGVINILHNHSRHR